MFINTHVYVCTSNHVYVNTCGRVFEGVSKHPLEGKLGGQTGDKIMKLTAKKHPTKKTSAKIASKINTLLSGVYEGIFADVMIFFSFALLSDAKAGKDG